MEENGPFKLVFSKLRVMLEEERSYDPESAEAVVHRASEITNEELDEIDNLRRIVIEVTEPVPVSFTTT